MLVQFFLGFFLKKKGCNQGVSGGHLDHAHVRAELVLEMSPQVILT